MSPVLTRDAIRAINDRQVELVEVPQWQGSLYVWGLTGKERDEFELGMLVGKGKNAEINLKNLRARLILLTAYDSDDFDARRRVFEPSDLSWLGDKSAAALQVVYAVAQKLSGLSSEDVDEMTESLGNDQSGDSGSDSPLTLASVSEKPKSE